MSEHDKILPLVQSSSQGMVSNELLQPMLPEETLWEKVLHPISPVLRGESSHSVISALGTINSSDTAAREGGLCPWERKDNAAVPPGVTGSASRPACPRTAALSSGRVPPPEQTPPPANRREIRLGSCILGTDPTDTWGGLGNNQFVPL